MSAVSPEQVDNLSIEPAIEALAKLEEGHRKAIYDLGQMVLNSGSDQLEDWERLAFGLTGSAEVYDEFKNLDDKLKANVHEPIMLVPKFSPTREDSQIVQLAHNVHGLWGFIDGSGSGTIHVPATHVYKLNITKSSSASKGYYSPPVFPEMVKAEKQNLRIADIYQDYSHDHTDYRTPEQKKQQPVSYHVVRAFDQVLVGLGEMIGWDRSPLIAQQIADYSREINKSGD